jgi:CRISPR/Cas system CMR-associated protein Cmr1 (group 7 of RAMP superfamily)
MKKMYSSNNYEWFYSYRYGVGYFKCIRTKLTTDYETGIECKDMLRQLRRLDQKTTSRRYPREAPNFCEIFDSIASEYTYT